MDRNAHPFTTEACRSNAACAGPWRVWGLAVVWLCALACRDDQPASTVAWFI